MAAETLPAVLEKRSAELKLALPAGVNPDRFLRVVKDAVNRNRELLECRPASVVDACARAAQDGLLIDGREAALVIFKKRAQVNGVWQDVGKEAQYIPMVFGLRKLIYQSGEVSVMQTGIVFQKEIDAGRFEYVEGTDARLVHQPILDDDLGPPVAVYSVVTFKNRTHSIEVMRWSEVMKIAKSQRKNLDKQNNLTGVWKDHTTEMARKTVLRRHAKSLPLESEIAVRAMERLDDLYDPDDAIHERETGRRNGGARDRLKEVTAPIDPPHDSDGVIDHDPGYPDEDQTDHNADDDTLPGDAI